MDNDTRQNNPAAYALINAPLPGPFRPGDMVPQAKGLSAGEMQRLLPELRIPEKVTAFANTPAMGG
jgi:hypothetical protein